MYYAWSCYMALILVWIFQGITICLCTTLSNNVGSNCSPHVIIRQYAASSKYMMNSLIFGTPISCSSCILYWLVVVGGMPPLSIVSIIEAI